MITLTITITVFIQTIFMYGLATEKNEHIHLKVCICIWMRYMKPKYMHTYYQLTMCIRNASKIYLVMTAADLTYGIRA